VTIQVDSRERKFSHVTDAFDRLGARWFVSKLPCGDYCDFDRPRLAIDRKQSLQEVCGNIAQQHERFRDELTRALDLGIKLIFLVEHSKSIRCLSDVRHWVNPRRAVSPMALEGFDLYRRMASIEDKYRTEWHFCAPDETGQRILQLLQADSIITEIERR